MKQGTGANNYNWTPAEIKYIEETRGNGFFFSEDTMKFFKDKMSDFKTSNKGGRTILTNKRRGSQWEWFPDEARLKPYHEHEKCHEKEDGEY